MISVRRCSAARSMKTCLSSARPAANRSAAARICSARAVSLTSFDVRPRWTKRLSGPSDSATECRNELMSWRVSARARLMPSMSYRAPRIFPIDSASISPSSAHASQTAISTSIPGVIEGSLAPDARHFRSGVLIDHRWASTAGPGIVPEGLLFYTRPRGASSVTPTAGRHGSRRISCGSPGGSRPESAPRGRPRSERPTTQQRRSLREYPAASARWRRASRRPSARWWGGGRR